MKIPNRKPTVSEKNTAISSELSSPSYPNITLPIELEDMSQPSTQNIAIPPAISTAIKLNRDARLSLLRPNTLSLQEAYNEKTKTDSKLSIFERSNLLTNRILNYFLGKDDNAEERTYLILDTLCQRDPKTLLALLNKLLAIGNETHPSLIQNPNQLNQIVIMAPQKSSTPSTNLPTNQILTVPTEKLSDDIKSSFAEIVRKHTKKD